MQSSGRLTFYRCQSALSSADLLPDNPYDTMNQGCDFLRNHQSPSVDFATIHLWPDSWLTDVDDERRVQFARRWINCHVDVCTQLLNKPLVLAEFGWKLDGRAAYFDKVSEPYIYIYIYQCICSNRSVQNLTSCWCLSCCNSGLTCSARLRANHTHQQMCYFVLIKCMLY